MEDTTAPEIQSFTLSSSQIDLSEEKSIKATIRLTDQISGIGDNQLLNAAVLWRSPSGKQFVDASFYETSSGNNNDSVFIEDINFNQYAEEGEWTIKHAETTDNAGNHKWLYPEELKTLSLNRPITVFRSGNSNSSSESSTVITEKSTPDNSSPNNEQTSSFASEGNTSHTETIQESKPSATSYIDQSGNTFLITRKPTEDELAYRSNGGIYSNAMNHGTDFVSAIYKDQEIPLWYSDEYRTSKVTAGYAFVIEQAEYDKETGDILAISTRGSWIGNEKAIATPESPDYDYYAIHRYSKESGDKMSMWNFSTRSWSSPSEGSTIMFPRNGQWELLPASVGSIFESQWEDAVKDFPELFDDKKGLKAKISLENPRKSMVSNSTDKQTDLIKAPSKFNKKSADKITNFNPSTDTLEIDTDSFGIDSSATFAAGKNKKAVKKKLAKQDFNFLYDDKKGGLYFNENGVVKGFGEGGIIAILKGAPDLTSDNLEFI